MCDHLVGTRRGATPLPSAACALPDVSRAAVGAGVIIDGITLRACPTPNIRQLPILIIRPRHEVTTVDHAVVVGRACVDSRDSVERVCGGRTSRARPPTAV